ncbi:acyl-CoA carboxylase epsilon subunit [Nonomuraea sp. NPDC046802]|uniref:acyl-CoA carboxylase epsilon subunit n=1 Tax=Nonomuraea sp. NPDC046802 TaxID=3154919 RepID=UPI00340E1268
MSDIQIIRGNPDPEQVAALVIALAALAGRRRAAEPARLPAAAPSWPEHSGGHRPPDAWTSRGVTPWHSPQHHRHRSSSVPARPPS